MSKSHNTIVIAMLMMISLPSLAQTQVVSGEYIVKFKSQPVPEDSSGDKFSAGGRKAALKARAFANKVAADRGQKLIQNLGEMRVRRKFEQAGMMHLDQVSAAKLSLLKEHPDVEFIEPNYVLSLDPNEDEGDQNAFGVAPAGTDSYGQSGTQTQVKDSWDVALPYNQGTKPIVAVVDTGVDIRHAVFANSNSIWENAAEKNGVAGVDDDSNGYIDDINGWNFVINSGSMYDDKNHGTHVAGIILGVGQDILKVPVREAKIKIMPLKFLDANGSGTTANAINAIYYAVNNGAKVINNSWGGSSYSRSLHDAYKFAYDNNVVLVSAAGNSGVNIDSTPMYPASYDTPSNISVGSSTSSDQRSYFSNYSSNLVHVFAPGSSILSTIPGAHCAIEGNLYTNCFQSLSGTSMAAPFVAGLAALIAREATQLSAYQIKGIVLGSADLTSALNNLAVVEGRVNALTAINQAKGAVATTSWLPSYSPVYKLDSSSVASSDASGGGGGCGLVKLVSSSTSSGTSVWGLNSEFFEIGLVFGMALAPLLLAFALRRKAVKPARGYVRKYERFELAKQVMIQIGDQVIDSASETVSLGGLSFKTDVNVTQGQKIKLKIGDMNEEVEGEVVWSAAHGAFGVRFTEVTDSLKAQIQSWTVGLQPT